MSAKNKIDDYLNENTSKRKIATVGDLIKQLQKMPEDAIINVDVDKSYGSYVNNVYIDQREKKRGNNIVIIAV